MVKTKYEIRTSSDKELLEKGLLLPLMEAFYTIQGEGVHSGKPAYFVRIGGCDVGCQWCDVKESWNAKLHPPTATDSILDLIKSCPSKAVVVTGGEPMTYNFDYFCSKLSEFGFTSFLETSGSQKHSGKWDWVCLSPKRNKPPRSEFYKIANELKVIISNESDFLWAEENASKVNSDCTLFLQPEWSKSKAMMQQIVDYVLADPKWKISIQSHKYMNIP